MADDVEVPLTSSGRKNYRKPKFLSLVDPSSSVPTLNYQPASDVALNEEYSQAIDVPSVQYRKIRTPPFDRMVSEDIQRGTKLYQESFQGGLTRAQTAQRERRLREAISQGKLAAYNKKVKAQAINQSRKEVQAQIADQRREKGQFISQLQAMRRGPTVQLQTQRNALAANTLQAPPPSAYVPGIPLLKNPFAPQFYESNQQSINQQAAMAAQQQQQQRPQEQGQAIVRQPSQFMIPQAPPPPRQMGSFDIPMQDPFAPSFTQNGGYQDFGNPFFSGGVAPNVFRRPGFQERDPVFGV